MIAVVERPTVWQRLRPVLLGFDLTLMIAVLLTCAIGLVTMYSAGYDYGTRFTDHARNMALAFGVLFVAAQISPQNLMRVAVPLYTVGLALLVATAVFGITKKGAQRWLNVGVQIQPSEIMKLAMPLMLAWWFQKREGQLRALDFAIAGLILLVPVALVAKQPDLGTAILILSAGLYVIFFAGLSWKLILPVLLLAVIGIVAVVWSEDRICQDEVIWPLMRDYQKHRICTLLDPTTDPLGKGFHIIQGMIAIGSGGVTGKGFMSGTQTHLEFIPERTTDFIFAAFSEEFGMLGALLLLFGFTLLIFRGLAIAADAPSVFTRLLAGSITLSFFTYAFVNMGMVSGILPVVGVPLPFVSYGGTAMVTLGLGLGFLTSIARNRRSVQTSADARALLARSARGDADGAAHEAHREQRARRLRAARRRRARRRDRDGRAVLLGDLLHDRQAEPAAVDIGAERAVEGLEHLFALVFGDTWSRILDLQHDDLPVRVGHQAHRHRAAGRGVLQRVVDQVADQLAHQHRLAVQARRGGLRVGAFVAEVDALVHRARDEVAHDLRRELDQRHVLQAARLFGVLGARHRQQLVDQVRRALARARDLLERTLDGLRIAAGVDLALRELGLHAQARERRLHLVRGVGQEVLLRGHRLVQPRQQVVDRAHQRRDFLGHVVVVDRAQVLAFAPADALLQRVERRDAAREREPHQQHRHRQDHELRQDHALDDLGGQPRALVEGLGHLHDDAAVRARRRPDPQAGHAHRVVVDGVVAELHLVGRRAVLGRRRELGVAAGELALRVAHLVPDAIDVVAAQQRRGGFGQAQVVTAGEAALEGRVGAHLARDAVRQLPELAIVGPVRDALRDEPGQRDAHRPQQKQRREHPVEDLAKQGALFVPVRHLGRSA